MTPTDWLILFGGVVVICIYALVEDFLRATKDI